MDFQKRYNNLNINQKQAVDTIEGTVMVVAGPGTGKTELLSMRVANILQKTDALPESILALTFTDSGSIAMQKRLFSIIGKDAYKVHIHTFHEFGSNIISRFPEYFYEGAKLDLATDIDKRRIITKLLDDQRYDNPLKKSYNGEYTTINTILNAVSDFKSSGFLPAELRQIVENNLQELEAANQILAPIFNQRMNPKLIAEISAAVPKLQNVVRTKQPVGIKNITDILAVSLQEAVEPAAESGKTTSLTAWKKVWFKKDATNAQVLKSIIDSNLLLAALDFYEQYTKVMSEEKLYDYDDMILQVVQKIENNPELRFELQENFQYIMVDEFQDTNLAQMKILHGLTDNPVNEGNPNLLVVGDDDQAIYGFQGADVGNILDFNHTYPKAKLITLTDNYRSAPIILQSAQEVISQGVDRLENKIEQLNKTLTPHHQPENSVAKIVSLKTSSDEKFWIASDIKAKLQAGADPAEIAVIARNHKDLESLVPFLVQNQIAVKYDRSENILESEVVVQLKNLAQIIIELGNGNHGAAEALLPELMSHPVWQFDPETLWKISLNSNKNRSTWMETMLATPETEKFQKWLINLAVQAKNWPLEQMIDQLMGVQFAQEKPEQIKQNNQTPSDVKFKSPFACYFFSSGHAAFIDNIENLTTIRGKMREQLRDEKSAKLSDFVQLIDEYNAAKQQIIRTSRVGNQDSINLMTAHGSKGLEFETVYVMNTTNKSWSSRKNSGIKVNYPENLRLKKSTDSDEEVLRLFFVAMTRAKNELILTNATEEDSGKEMLPASFISSSQSLNREDQTELKNQNITTEIISTAWYAPIIAVPRQTMASFLASTLDHYKLSATHINNFVDVSGGGPQFFLLNNLLHFPSAQNPSSYYGTAMHAAMQFAHEQINLKKQKPSIDQIVDAFEKELDKKPLDDKDYQNFKDKGRDSLNGFLQKNYDSLNQNQKPEVDFRSQNVVLNGAKLTGKLDVLEIDKTAKSLAVQDYKTGKVIASWTKGGQDYDKIKKHKYRQQLMFYRLLLENSDDYKNYDVKSLELVFLEPSLTGEYSVLNLDDIGQDEYQDFQTLVGIVWQKIQNLDFPDTSNYEQNFNGLLQFEQDLLDGKI